MQYLSIQSMKTMHYVPELDWRFLRYAATCAVAVTTSMVAVAAYASTGY